MKSLHLFHFFFSYKSFSLNYQNKNKKRSSPKTLMHYHCFMLLNGGEESVLWILIGRWRECRKLGWFVEVGLYDWLWFLRNWLCGEEDGLEVFE
jgi:hypothetical protein